MFKCHIKQLYQVIMITLKEQNNDLTNHKFHSMQLRVSAPSLLITKSLVITSFHFWKMCVNWKIEQEVHSVC